MHVAVKLNRPNQLNVIKCYVMKIFEDFLVKINLSSFSLKNQEVLMNDLNKICV